MIPEYEELLKRSNAKHKDILKKMRYLSKLNRNGFDITVHGYHDDIFSVIDCTKCGNCCRNYGPRFRETDIKLACRETGMDPRIFKHEKLEQDPDGVGYILKELPCPFQNTDNTCSIYAVRTLSCRQFPHTLEKNIQRRLVGLALDSRYCPAAYLIAERIIAEY
jgi:hypothetical protein